RGSNCSVHSLLGVLSLGMAAGVSAAGHARFSVAARLGACVLPSCELSANHPRITLAERQMIMADTQGLTETKSDGGLRWRHLLKLPQTWGTVIAKAFTDPVWFFITDWFPIYLVAKGISLKTGLIAVWIPFIAADLGNFFGGAGSGYLIRRGWFC